MLKDQIMPEQIPSAEKKNCKEVIKCQKHCSKKTIMGRLGIIIHSY